MHLKDAEKGFSARDNISLSLLRNERQVEFIAIERDIKITIYELYNRYIYNSYIVILILKKCTVIVMRSTGRHHLPESADTFDNPKCGYSAYAIGGDRFNPANWLAHYTQTNFKRDNNHSDKHELAYLDAYVKH